MLIQTKYVLMGAIALEGFGGLLFTVGSSVGAYFLVRYWPLCFKKLGYRILVCVTFWIWLIGCTI